MQGALSTVRLGVSLEAKSNHIILVYEINNESTGAKAINNRST